jgi:hypothetical protein
LKLQIVNFFKNGRLEQMPSEISFKKEDFGFVVDESFAKWFPVLSIEIDSSGDQNDFVHQFKYSWGGTPANGLPFFGNDNARSILNKLMERMKEEIEKKQMRVEKLERNSKRSAEKEGNLKEVKNQIAALENDRKFLKEKTTEEQFDDVFFQSYIVLRISDDRTGTQAFILLHFGSKPPEEASKLISKVRLEIQD